MAEIPFYLGGRPKWVSGVSSSTTCEDIINSMLNCPQFDVNLYYVLVEKWRDVEKILKPDSLILKIWNSWSEEQPNVKFTVKKIKKATQTSEYDKESVISKSMCDITDKPSVTGNITSDLHDNNKFAKVKKSGVRRRNSITSQKQSTHITDTKHPKALEKSEGGYDRKIATDIESIMRKIVVQGENIREYLVSIQKEKERRFQPGYLEDQRNFQNFENIQTFGGEFENVGYIKKSDKSRTGRSSDTLTFENKDHDTGIGTEESDSTEKSEDELPQNKSQDNSDEGYTEEIDNDLQFQAVSNDQLYEWMEVLEKLYSLNLLLQSEEEKLVNLNSECKILSILPPAVPMNSQQDCMTVDALRLRDVNAVLSQEISQNQVTLNDIMIGLDTKRKFIRQLEFDVNVVEREGKRLESDHTHVSKLVITRNPVISESSTRNFN